MNLFPHLFAAALAAHPLPNPDVLEPSVLNEVEHAISRGEIARMRAFAERPGERAALMSSLGGKDATTRALRLVSTQRADGSWLLGSTNVTDAALSILNELAGVPSGPVETDSLKPFALRRAPLSEKYENARPHFVGCPSVTASPHGRLWCAFMIGDADSEGDANYNGVFTSHDGGRTWSGPKLVIDCDGPLRALDVGLWTDPDGRVRIFWAQSYSFWDGRGGLFTATLEDAESADSAWSDPRRLSDGYLKNKPTVLSSGEWLFPIEYMPYNRPVQGGMRGMKPNVGAFAHPECGGSERAMGVAISSDAGRTLQSLGRAYVKPEDRTYSENMVVERRDGTLVMYGRLRRGMGEALSKDRGKTWTEMTYSTLKGPSSRFYFGRLKSGALLLVKNGPNDRDIGRVAITAYVSDDEGATWKGGLVLDARKNVSYPDVCETADGCLHVVHDREREGAREILHHVFTERDVRAGRAVSPASRFGDIVFKSR